MNYRRLVCWIIDLFHWLAEVKLVFMFFIVLVGSIMLGFVAWRTESSIRTSGYLLQLFGMIFAVRGLLGIRAHFSLPTLKELLLNWLKAFPKWKRTITVTVPTTNMEARVGNARVSTWHQDKPEKSLEERIDCIIYNLEKLRKAQKEQFELIDKLADRHKYYEKNLLMQTIRIQDDIRSDLETLHTSDSIFSLIGLIWLLIGLTMSTMAPEIYEGVG